MNDRPKTAGQGFFFRRPAGWQGVRRRFIASVLGAAGLSLFSALPAAAESYPTKSVRIVVNFPPGGVADQIARVLAAHLQRGLGQPFIVENRAGANGNIGAAEVVRAAGDGYTLLLSPSGVVAVNGLLYPNLQFDPMKDLVPVASQLVVNSYLVVHPGLPVTTMQEFLAYLRARPGRLNYGTPGSGSSPHLAAELLKRQAGVDATHVPYKGAAPALTDLLGGQIDFMFDPGPGLPHIRSGKLRLLAVAGSTRAPAFPTVPTVSEVIGKDFDAGTLFGLLAPKGTPATIVTRLETAAAAAMETPEMQKIVTSLGAESKAMGSAAYAAQLARIHEQMGELVRVNKLTAE